MKVLYREDEGRHYHNNLSCGFVDNDYKIISDGEAHRLKLLPCPFCYHKSGIYTNHSLPIVYLLYHKDTEEDIMLHGIFTEEEIRQYRHEVPNTVCFLIPMNYFVKNGVLL